MFPWNRHRRELEVADIEKAAAKQENAASEVRRQAVYQQTEKSRAVTNGLRGELELNGWTELLQDAWGRRAGA